MLTCYVIFMLNILDFNSKHTLNTILHFLPFGVNSKRGIFKFIQSLKKAWSVWIELNRGIFRLEVNLTLVSLYTVSKTSVWSEFKAAVSLGLFKVKQTNVWSKLNSYIFRVIQSQKQKSW